MKPPSGWLAARWLCVAPCCTWAVLPNSSASAQDRAVACWPARFRTAPAPAPDVLMALPRLLPCRRWRTAADAPPLRPTIFPGGGRHKPGPCQSGHPRLRRSRDHRGAAASHCFGLSFCSVVVAVNCGYKLKLQHILHKPLFSAFHLLDLSSSACQQRMSCVIQNRSCIRSTQLDSSGHAALSLSLACRTVIDHSSQLSPCLCS